MDEELMAAFDQLSDEDKSWVLSQMQSSGAPAAPKPDFYSAADLVNDVGSTVSDYTPSWVKSAAQWTGDKLNRVTDAITHVFPSLGDDGGLHQMNDIVGDQNLTEDQKMAMVDEVAKRGVLNSWKNTAISGGNAALLYGTLGAGGLGATTAEGMLPEAAGTLATSAARAIGFGTGATTANFAGDQAMQELGLHQDTPIGQDVAAIPGQFGMDAGLGFMGELIGRTIAPWAEARWQAIRERFNPDAKLVQAYSPMGVSPDVREREAILGLRGKTIAGQGVIDDLEASRGSAREAFGTARQNLEDFRTKTGQDIANLRGQIPEETSVPYSDVKDYLTPEERQAFALSKNPDEQLIVDEATFNRERLARKGAQQEIEDRVFGKASNPLTRRETMLDQGASDIQDNFANQLDTEPFRYNQLLKARQLADEQAQWNRTFGSSGVPSDIRMARDRANALRDLERKMVGDLNIGPQYGSLMEDYTNASRAMPGVSMMEAMTYAGPPAAPYSLNNLVSKLRGVAGRTELIAGAPPSEQLSALRIGTGASRPSPFGLAATGGLADATNALGSAEAMGGIGAAGNLYQDQKQSVPESDVLPLQGPLRPSPVPVTAQPKPGFAIPRQMNMIDPGGIERIIFSYFPEESRVPIALQWRSVVATGDKRKMATMLGAISDKYPDFPLQTGPITGLPSEFDIGDGRMRLFSPTDIDSWEKTISESTLNPAEKAQRVMALRKDHVVIPFTMSVTGPKVDIPMTASDMAMSNIMKHGGPTTTQQGSLGSRRAWP